MNHKRNFFLLSAVLLLFFLAAGTVAAQSDERGTIRGAVYIDVNGDGQCVNTGIAGEDPVSGVEIQFVSSDEATVVTLTTGEDGTYGLAAAGQSIWQVTARPDPAKWTVTSENPLYAPVLPESLIQTDVNFCVGQGANAIIVLPQSGGAAANPSQMILAFAVLGLAIFFAGASLEVRRRANR